MEHLHLTCHIVGRPRYQEFQVLKDFVNLETFYLGFTVPHRPTRMEMDILLNLYQAIWHRKMGNLLESFPKIKTIGFWNAPEKILEQLSKRALPLDTLNFGSINQPLTMLCSFDSILQTLFRFEELENTISPPRIKNLNMNLHTMPTIGLEYYLPNLMCRVNLLADLKKVSLLLKCVFNAKMTSSWSLETKHEKASRRPFMNSSFTEFEFHSEGLCGLFDLDRQLPPSLETCTVSLNLPAESGHNVVPSVLDFISKLGSINNFPELSEFHIQVLGVKCFEPLVHAIGDHLGPYLKKVSIYAPLKYTEKASAKSLLTRIGELFPKAIEISLPTDFLKVLISESSQSSPQWPDKIRKLARKHNFNVEQCRLSTGRLPRNSNFICKEEEPRDLTEEENDAMLEELEETSSGEVEMLENNDWIVDGDECEDEEDVEFQNSEIVYESEEDELDDLERKLEKESDRRHKKWQKKNRVMLDSDEEQDDEKENEEEEDDHDIIDWEKLDELDDQEEDESNSTKDGLLDDLASEASEDEEDMENEEEDEEESEGEDLADSDDERLFENGPTSKKRRNEHGKQNSKRRRIVISDEDED